MITKGFPGLKNQVSMVMKVSNLHSIAKNLYQYNKLERNSVCLLRFHGLGTALGINSVSRASASSVLLTYKHT